MSVAIHRKIGSLHAFVASILLLDGEVLDGFGLIKLGELTFNWFEVSPKFLSFAIQQAWTRHFTCRKINRNGWNIQDFDAVGNEIAYGKLSPMDRALVDSLISGRHCTNDFLAKFMPGVTSCCSLCQATDSRRHRLFDCPALSKFRQGKAGLKRAAKWQNGFSCFGLCPPVPLVPERLEVIANSVPFSLPDPDSHVVTVFTDGSAFFADIKQLTIASSAFIVTVPGTFCLTESESALVPGPEQNSFIAELFAIIMALNRHFRLHIFTDCQVVCDLVNLAISGECVKQAIGTQSISLWNQLMHHITKRPPDAIVISKVKAHLNHKSIQDPILRWKVWANNQVDKIAKDTIRIQHSRLFRKLEKIHRQVSLNRQDILELYKFWALASHKCIEAEVKKRKERCEPNVLDCTKPPLVFSPLPVEHCRTISLMITICVFRGAQCSCGESLLGPNVWSGLLGFKMTVVMSHLQNFTLIFNLQQGPAHLEMFLLRNSVTRLVFHCIFWTMWTFGPMRVRSNFPFNVKRGREP